MVFSANGFSVAPRSPVAPFSSRMIRLRWKQLLVAADFLLVHPASAQDPLRSVLTMGFGDVAAIKQKAEAGDAQAQVALADLLAQHFRSSEALHWYRKAVDQGNTSFADASAIPLSRELETTVVPTTFVTVPQRAKKTRIVRQHKYLRDSSAHLD